MEHIRNASSRSAQVPKRNKSFLGARVLIMGLGLHGGGVAAVRFFHARGARITVTDLRSEKELASSLGALSSYTEVKYVLGEHRRKDFLESDLIIKNPGVSWNSPYLKFALEHGIPVKSEVGIFFEESPAEIVGITGTRGKSTTTFLIWKFLKQGNARVYLGGNIRKSMLPLLGILRAEDIVVLELSSFQLEDLAKIRRSPHIAVFTNILRDHINRHGSMRAYIRAKCNIFRFQGTGDHLFINPEDTRLRALRACGKSRVHMPVLSGEWHTLVDNRLGMHYRTSVGLAIGVARHFGIGHAAMKEALSNFRGLPGRMEIVERTAGITFVNDTTATIPDATIAALKRFRIRADKGKLILIAGGQDKKLVFLTLARMIKKYAL
ncbi:MAG: UDP-N-acetylmuramoylalanine--D-glutamate ligase, partial [Parcubacteria group bacterium Gr01-1014_66]